MNLRSFILALFVLCGVLCSSSYGKKLTPRLLAPDRDEKFVVGEAVLLRWDAVDEAVEYEVRIKGPFDTIVERTKLPELVIPSLMVGRYTWQVVTPAGRASSPWPFTIEPPPPPEVAAFRSSLEKISIVGASTVSPLPLKSRVCLVKFVLPLRNPIPLACGFVIEKDGFETKVELESQAEELPLGPAYAIEQPERAPASLPSPVSYTVTSLVEAPKVSLNGGVSMGPSFVVGYISGAYGVSSKLSVGAWFAYAPGVSADLRLSSYGALFEAAYYFTSIYRGFFVSVAGGAYWFDLTSETISELGKTSAAGRVGLGWAMRPSGGGFSASALGGLQSVATPRLTDVQTPFEGTKPFLQLQLGYTF